MWIDSSTVVVSTNRISFVSGPPYCKEGPVVGCA